MTKIYDINGNYTQSEKEMYKDIIDSVRLRIADDDPYKNVLNGYEEQISDGMIISLAKEATRDINSNVPRTKYSTEYIYSKDSELLIEGIMIFFLIHEGLLQTANQIDFNDNGLGIAMFNKTALYQSWYSSLLQLYLQHKQDWKDSIIPSSANSGFFGIQTEFGYRWY